MMLADIVKLSVLLNENQELLGAIDNRNLLDLFDVDDDDENEEDGGEEEEG
jgi:hypothetical protein